MTSSNSSISHSSIQISSSEPAINSTSNYTSESIKLLLMNDSANYKVIPNQSKRVSAGCWKRMEMGFPAKKLHDKDEFIAIPSFASCFKCWETYRYVNSSTTHINSHKCPKLLSSNQTSLHQHFLLTSSPRQTDQHTVPVSKAIVKRKEEMKKVCARWIAHSMRSFQIVQDSGFKDVIDVCLTIGREFGSDTVISSNDIISCDRTIKNEIKRLAAHERLLLKDCLVEAVKYGGVCISPGIWSDKYRKICYLGATVHFAEKDSKYYSVDLFCTEFKAKKKSGENIMKLLRKELLSFGLEDYLSDIVFVTDRGSNFVKGLDGFTVLFCTAHRLNNILKHTFYQNLPKEKKNDKNKTTTTVIERIEKTPNKTTKYRTTIQASPETDSQTKLFDGEDDCETDDSEVSDDDSIVDYSSTTINDLPTSAREILDTIHYCKALVNLDRHIQVEQEDEYSSTADDDSHKKQFSKFTTLHQSSIVRWLSLHELLSSIEKAYHPLKHILHEKQESSRLEKINMNIVSQLIQFLEPWRYVINEIQLGNSPSLYMVLPCIGYLKQQITKMERTMRGGMKLFAKRASQLLESMFKIENLHAMGTFLHPNYKQLRNATQMQIIECHRSCRMAIPASSTSTTISSNDCNDINEPLAKKPKLFLESLMDDVTPVVVTQTKDEVDLYIDLQLKDNEIYTNPLIFWQQHQSMFPYLSKLARKIFAIPCSSAAVERAFSAAGQVVTQRRSSLEPTTINDILFLRSVENNKRHL
ncbi:unnamed protein product [Rotaria sp. Silwood2]|nr:unnamed protein product [Rotaria sp. Silwood2]CAF4590954.1 unnamed protein product [Rotaria sp. Silwood2]